jgi:hypothetical protein
MQTARVLDTRVDAGVQEDEGGRLRCDAREEIGVATLDDPGRARLGEGADLVRAVVERATLRRRARQPGERIEIEVRDAVAGRESRCHRRLSRPRVTDEEVAPSHPHVPSVARAQRRLVALRVSSSLSNAAQD